MMNYRYPYFED